MSLISSVKALKVWLRNTYFDLIADIYARLFYHKKIQNNKIIFNNFNGKGFGDSPKYIALEIIRQKLPYDLVWMVKDPTISMPAGIRKVKVGSLQAALEYATTRILICNSKQKLPFIKKKEQYYIQTWHGAFPLKFIEKEAEALLSKRYIRNSIKDSSITDVMLSGSGMESKVMKDSFWFTGEIYECGIPRDDIFFNTTSHETEALKNKYALPLHCKIITYAPTFRDNGSLDAYNIDLNKVLETLEQKTGEKWVCIVRLHPNISQHDGLFCYNEKIINGTQFPDPQELFLLSDWLITDYSSVMMDFGLMKKPVILYMPDFKEYQQNRGLRPIFDHLPFPYAYTLEELYTIIQNFNLEKYLHKLADFTENYYHNFSDGHASKRVVNRIKEKIR